MVQRFENWQSPDQKFADESDDNFLRGDSRWIPWLFAVLISLVLWAILIGLVFFAMHIYFKNDVEPTPVIFSERFQPFADISGGPHPVILLDPSLRKCIAGMQAPWGNHGLPY